VEPEAQAVSPSAAISATGASRVIFLISILPPAELSHDWLPSVDPLRFDA
jgi:hypothetical protein